MHCLCLLTPWLAKKSLEMSHEDIFCWPRLPLCSKDISRQHPQGVLGKQPCSPFFHLAQVVPLALLQKGKVPASSVLLKSCAKRGMENEQQHLWKTGGSHLAWSRLCSLERGWDTAVCPGAPLCSHGIKLHLLLFCSQLTEELNLQEAAPPNLG